MIDEKFSDYHSWINYLKEKPARIKEAYIPTIVREFQIPIQIVKVDLGLEEDQERIKTFSTAVLDLIDFLDKPKIYSLYEPVDNLIGGYFQGQVIILAGRSRTGKTTIALNMIDKFLQQNVPVLFFSLEMSAARVTQRIFQMKTGASDLELRRSVALGLFEKEFLDKIGDEYFKNLIIYDKGALPAQELDIVFAEACEHLGKQVKVVFIDYFELVKIYSKDTLEQSSKVSKIISDFAKRNKVITFILHQCNRAGEGKEIQINHIRYAGEEDADLIYGFWRPNYEEESKGNAKELLVEMKVLKNRDGREGKFHLIIDTKTLSIVSVNEVQENQATEEKTETLEHSFDEIDEFSF